MTKKLLIIFFRHLFMIVLISSFFLLSENTVEGSSPLQKRGIARFKGIKKWEGKIHYKLDFNEEIGDATTSFLELKGLKGTTLEKIIIDGEVTFNSAGGNGVFVAKGKVKYSLSFCYVSSLGEAIVIHLTDGKGSAAIEPIRQINYLFWDYLTKQTHN